MVDTDLLAVKKITLNLVTYISEHCQHQVIKNKWLLLNRLHFIQPPMRRMLVLAWMMAQTLWKDVRRLVEMTVDTSYTYMQYTYTCVYINTYILLNQIRTIKITKGTYVRTYFR